MSRLAEPSDRSPLDCAFCTCLTTRFDAVTLKTGERHSEFCCACGRPGPSDVVSGRPLVENLPEPMQEAPVPGETFVRLGDAWRKATMADEQRMLLHYMQTGEWPRWCSHGLRHALGSGDVTRLSSEALEPHPTLRREDLEHYARTGHEPKPRSPARFQRIWRSFPSYDAISNIEGVHIADMPPPQVTVQDPAQVIATYRDAAVPGQRYERPIYSMVRPAPYDAVLAQVGGSEVLPELAPSFVGCLRAIFVYRSILIPWFLACYDNGPNERLVIEAERSVMAEMVHGTLEQRIRLEARVDENLRWYEEWNHHQRVQGLKAASDEIVPWPVRETMENVRYLRVLLRGVPPYRDAGRAIGSLYGSSIHLALCPVPTWATSEPLVVGDDLWVNVASVSELARFVTAKNDDRRRWNPGAVPLRVIVPTVNAVQALLRDMDEQAFTSALPPAALAFDYKTAPKTGPTKRLLEGSGRWSIGEATYFVGIDPGIGPSDQGKTVIARKVDGVVTLEAIDDTPLAGWAKEEIHGRIRAINADAHDRAISERLRERVKASVTAHLRSLERGVEVSDVGTEKDRDQGVMRANVTVRAPVPAIKTPLAWTWPGDFTVPSLASENPPSLYIAKARTKAGPAYRVAFPPSESPPSAPTSEGNVCTFAYAPGERDAYPVGQAPGEKLCWPDPMGDPDDAPPAWTPWRPR